MAKGKVRGARREAQWRRVIRGQRQSGLSVREFCRKNRLREPTFYFWRRELERRDVARRQEKHASDVALAKPEEQRERPSAAARRTVRPAFVPVCVAEETPTQSHGRIEIELSGGQRVHVLAPVDRQALAAVLTVLSLDLEALDREGRPC